MAPITVDPSVLIDAAAAYDRAHVDAGTTIRDLVSTLDTQWGCAGTDSAGKTWSEGYDPAAYEAIAAGTALVDAFAKLHDLFAFTAVNHLNTERANTAPPLAPEPAPTQLPPLTAPIFRGAYGGDGDTPFGWSLISRWLQGHTWPNGDPDKLRALSAAWYRSASALRASAESTYSTWASVESVVAEETLSALAQMDCVDVGIQQTADQYEALGGACRDWAHDIDDAHHKILAILAGAIAAGLIVGGVAGVLSAGTAVPFVEGGVGGSAGAAVVAVLIGFDGASAALVGTLTAAGIAAGGVVTQVQPLLEAVPTTFEAVSRGGGNNHQYHPPPRGGLPGFPEATQITKKGPRPTWRDKKGNTYEWDYQHGRIEKYSRTGDHLGEFDSVTREQTKPGTPGRTAQGK